jgi:hypothetical protein
MLALQGQDLPGAKWSVGVRAAGATEATVEAAFDAGEIVRSWPMRGTLHVVAADDLGWLLELNAPRALLSASARRAALGITDRDVERAREIAVSALTGRRTLGRSPLLDTLEAGGVATTGQRGYHLLWYLAQTGTLVLAASDGRGQAFALLDDWVAAPRRLERDEALGELVVRYVRSHGPVVAADIARWAGLTITDVRRGLAVGGAALTTVLVDGTEYHVAPELLGGEPDGRGDVRLLAGFDEYLLGYADRSATLSPEHGDLVVPGANGMFRPTVVVDGEVVGTWSRTVRSREVVVKATPFPGVEPGRLGGIDVAAEAYATFIGRPVRLA